MPHQLLKPYSLLLYLLAIVASFFAGVSYAGMIEAAKNQGLAGGAIVLGYGVVASGIGLVAALFIAYKTNRRVIFRLNIFLALMISAFYAYYHIKYVERQKAKEKIEQKPEPPKTETSPEVDD